MNGLSGHIGSIWRMMNRANCEDGILTACGKARSLEDLSNEVVEEMEVIAPSQNCKQCKCKDREAIA
jgi:hypothetical protein